MESNVEFEPHTGEVGARLMEAADLVVGDLEGELPLSHEGMVEGILEGIGEI